MSKRRKGKRHERQAEKLYKRAGYKTEITRGLRHGKTDWFGLFDIMAIHPERKVRYIQVKSNNAQGINEWTRRACKITPSEHVILDFLVKYDYEGWRMIRVSDGEYWNVYDERDEDCKIGEGLKAYLKNEN